MKNHLSLAYVPVADLTRLNNEPATVRVLHLHANTAWEFGLASFLRQESDLLVRSVTAASKPFLLGDMIRFKPDVILLNKDVPWSLAYLRQWLGSRLARSAARLIVIDLCDSLVDIYDTRQMRRVVVTHLTDISQCVRGLYPV